jgi:hypothetical protein
VTVTRVRERIAELEIGEEREVERLMSALFAIYGL